MRRTNRGRENLERKQAEAQERAIERATRSITDQLRVISDRRGDSRKETMRLQKKQEKTDGKS